MKKYFIFILMIIAACQPEKEIPEADRWVFDSIEQSGGDLYDHMQLTFKFRDHNYEARRDQGLFEYVRIKEDSNGITRDVLNNDGFYREINGERVDLADTMAAKYARSVNSVIYFALLPDGLDDEAVNRQDIGDEVINGINYHRVRVTFDQQGGGEDFEDVFIYWFNEQTGFFDYMAYLYHTDGGGIRFREAYNPRFVSGIRFMDFNNYKPADTLELKNIGQSFLNGELEKLSVIETENIIVQPL